MRRRATLIVLACTTLGAGVLLYAGPGRGLIRGFCGDVIAVVWLAYIFALLWPRHVVGCCIAALGVAFALEGLQALQLVSPDAPRVVRVMLGATFDPWDLVAYAVGFGFALALRRSAPGSR